MAAQAEIVELAPAQIVTIEHTSLARAALRRFLRHRLAVIGTRDARLAGDEATLAESRRPEKADNLPNRDKPATEDGERPNVWRRLTTTR